MSSYQHTHSCDAFEKHLHWSVSTRSTIAFREAIILSIICLPSIGQDRTLRTVLHTSHAECQVDPEEEAGKESEVHLELSCSLMQSNAYDVDDLKCVIPEIFRQTFLCLLLRSLGHSTLRATVKRSLLF